MPNMKLQCHVLFPYAIKNNSNTHLNNGRYHCHIGIIDLLNRLQLRSHCPALPTMGEGIALALITQLFSKTLVSLLVTQTIAL